MAGAKNHDYHILPPDIWPVVGAFSALIMATGGVFWMHKMAGGTATFFLGLLGARAKLDAEGVGPGRQVAAHRGFKSHGRRANR